MKDNRLTVSEQLEAKNPWYIAEQKLQLTIPAMRELIENRWSIIEKTILMMKKNNKEIDSFLVLDAGCGDGNNLLGLQKVSKNLGIDIQLYALDYNTLRVKRVKEEGGFNNVYCASLLQLPFPKQTFDLVICNQVLEHIPDYMLALHELYRVTKKNSYLLLGVPNEGCFIAQLRNNVLQRSILSNTDHVNFFTVKSLSKYTQLVGYSIKRVFRFGLFLPHFYLYLFLMKFTTMRKIVYTLGKLFPSQSADLQLLLHKK